MQIQALKRLILPTVFIMLLAGSTYAQTGWQFTVTIPFDFYVSGKTLPAGQYNVGRSTQSSADGLVLRATDRRAGVFVLTRGIQTVEIQQQTKLIFRRYGDRHFLGEVWISGRTTAQELPSSRKERLLRGEMTKLGAKPEKVAVLVEKW